MANKMLVRVSISARDDVLPEILLLPASSPNELSALMDD
jgi:hypothetical protein